MPDSSECFPCRRDLPVSKQLELLERLEPLEQASLRFKTMEDLNPQIKKKILSDNPRRFLRFPIGRFERLEQSAVVERLERVAVIGERLNRSLDLPLVQPLFANILCVRFECQSN